MTDSLTAKANYGSGTDALAVDLVPGGAAGVVKIALGLPGVVNGYVSAANPMPVTGTFTSSALTDTQLRASPVPVSGTVSVGNFPATQAVTGTFWQATQPVSGPLTNTELRAVAVPVSGTFWQTTQPVSVSSIAAGANLIGDVGIQARANATGAASAIKMLAAIGTNATVVKASAGRIYGYQLQNNGVATLYVKLHNVATTPVAGTTPITAIIAIPPAGTCTFSVPQGIAMTTGIAFTMVTGAADNDATGVSVNTIAGHLVYS